MPNDALSPKEYPGFWLRALTLGEPVTPLKQTDNDSKNVLERML
jgi:hypothetical protein